MPGSRGELFERYLSQAAENIAVLSPRARRYYQSEVRESLSKIGKCLWDAQDRKLAEDQLRNNLGDDSRPWDHSIIRLLLDEGILVRDRFRGSRSLEVRFAFDLLAGRVIADSLLEAQSSREIHKWLSKTHTKNKLWGKVENRHTLAGDIFYAFVGLVPLRLGRQQFWKMLGDEVPRHEAVRQCAWLSKSFLDQETVSQIESQIIAPPTRRKEDLFHRLRSIRSALGHPLNAEFLDRMLRRMSMPDRDLRWSEWGRKNAIQLIEDLEELVNTWKFSEAVSERDELRARWVMWLLTSSVRSLRDHATKALYQFGCLSLPRLFEMTLESLSVNDPYVPERMLAACYGTCMSMWADPKGEMLRNALPQFAETLVGKMWLPDAPHRTWHTLMQDYSLGILQLAERVSPGCVAQEHKHFLSRPFTQLQSCFRPAGDVDPSPVEATTMAMNMDFANYTVGRLVTDRSNYDYRHPEYCRIRRQLEERASQFGYDPKRFQEAERLIADRKYQSYHRRLPIADRYGKKYSWIAYFEMYGERFEKLRQETRWPEEDRTSDADIDPSFPEPPRTWEPLLDDVFSGQPDDITGWLRSGPSPNYEMLMEPDQVDNEQGPWCLIDGYIEQTSKNDARRIFTFLWTRFVAGSDAKALVEAFNAVDYPGNNRIPSPWSDNYVFAGEIPWSSRFGHLLRNSKGHVKRHLAFAFERGGCENSGIKVEIPVHEFSWETYHSELNQVNGITVPAPALCKRLGFVKHGEEWDLYQSNGRKGTIYREWQAGKSRYRCHLLYLRRDLLQRYLARTNQQLVWFQWGERDFEIEFIERHEGKMQSACVDWAHIHRSALLQPPL